MAEDRTQIRFLTQKLSKRGLTDTKRIQLHSLLMEINIVPIKKFSTVTVKPTQ